MLRSVLYPSLFVLAVTSLAVPAPAASGGFADAFEGGLRWLHGASLAESWVPGPVTFAAGDELVWVGTQVANRKVLLFAAPEKGVVAPVYRDPAVGLASQVLAVASGAGADRLFSLAQYEEPDPFHRRSVVACYSALQAGNADTFSPTWSVGFPFVANGPALFAVDEAGDTLVAAAFDSQSGLTNVRWMDGATGSTALALDLAGGGLDALVLSADGGRVALSIGKRLVVLASDGSLLHDEGLSTPANALALDATGSRLVLGKLGALRIYDFTGASYQLTREFLTSSDELASKVAVSADGSTYAAAWWNFRAVDRLRYSVYDGANHNLLNQVTQDGYPGSLQNSPVGVQMTADGSRIVFASWGRSDAAPEAVLLQRGQAQPLLEIDLPGSAVGVALSADGRRVALATKNMHANQFGSTGEVRLYNTGESDVELTEPARLGGSLELASRQPGASFALFMVGDRAPAPSYPAGTQGALWLVRNNRLQVTARPADGNGEASMSSAIPSHPALLGLDLSVQVANRVNGQVLLSETILDPLFY